MILIISPPLTIESWLFELTKFFIDNMKCVELISSIPFNSLIISPSSIPSFLALLSLLTLSTTILDEFLKLNIPKLLAVII